MYIYILLSTSNQLDIRAVTAEPAYVGRNRKSSRFGHVRKHLCPPALPRIFGQRLLSLTRSSKIEKKVEKNRDSDWTLFTPFGDILKRGSFVELSSLRGRMTQGKYAVEQILSFMIRFCPHLRAYFWQVASLPRQQMTTVCR